MGSVMIDSDADHQRNRETNQSLHTIYVDIRLALLDKKAGESVLISVLRGGIETGEKLEMEVELYTPTPPPGHP